MNILMNKSLCTYIFVGQITLSEISRSKILCFCKGSFLFSSWKLYPSFNKQGQAQLLPSLKSPRALPGHLFPGVSEHHAF